MSLSNEEITKKIKEVIAEQLSVSEDEITPESTYVDDLGADSLETDELVMALEEEFETEIADEEAEKLTTVQKTIDFIILLSD